MSTLTVVRWRKYGKDRLYVSDDAGSRIGWVDLQNGSSTIDVQSRATDFHQAVAHWYESTEGQPSRPAGKPAAAPPVEQPHAPAHRPYADTPGAEPATPLAQWIDLAENRPGQAAREQADAKLAVMRERSRVGTFIARALDMKTDERAWRVGAGGEETVGGRLEKLTKHGWHVLHAVPVGDRGSDIDHVVIGPGGVFTVNTKRHPDKSVWVGRNTVMVDGHRTNYLRNSRFEGERASRLLSEAVGFPVLARPALVFLTGSLFPHVTIKQAPDDVIILDRMDVPGAFRRATHRLAPEQVELIFEHARRSTTWQPPKESHRSGRRS
jgi:hypothetical protein